MLFDWLTPAANYGALAQEALARRARSQWVTLLRPLPKIYSEDYAPPYFWLGRDAEAL